MVEFIDQERQRCRKCKSKLPTPTGNDREAFCCRGCYEQHYRKHCRVCEREIKQPARGERVLCSGSDCKGAWRQKAGFGRFLKEILQNPTHPTSDAESISETPNFIEPKPPIKASRTPEKFSPEERRQLIRRAYELEFAARWPITTVKARA